MVWYHENCIQTKASFYISAIHHLEKPACRLVRWSICTDMMCPLEWVTCKNFGFLTCFRQGWVHVTLRNKKNIGLICFMFISSSYFWLLCRTKTAWWSKNEKMFQIGQNNLKNMSEVMLSHRRSNVRVYWQYICWFYKCFRQILAVQWTFAPIFFATVGSVNSIKVLWPNYLVFSLVKLFFLASPLSFLASLIMLMHLKSESLPLNL